MASMASFVERLDFYGVQDEVVYVETDLGKWSQLQLSALELGTLLQARNVVDGHHDVEGAEEEPAADLVEWEERVRLDHIF